MYLVSFDVDGADGVRRTQVFAGAATDALLFVDHGNEQDFLSGYLLPVSIFPAPAILMHSCLQGHHLYGLSGALAGAESAGFLVLDGDAKFACPDGVSDLNGSPLLYGDGLYCGCRADFGAAIAFRTTISSLETYLWLHEAVEAAAGPEHIVGTGIYTELAGSAMRPKVSDGERTWRRDEFLALWFLLFDKVCESSISSLGLDLALSFCQGCACEKGDGSQSCATSFVFFLGRGCGQGTCEVQSVVGALQFAVAADNATGVIDGVCL